MRAREPDVVGTLTRAGVDIGYEVFVPPAGSADRTIVFTPVDPIVQSGVWKAQVPYLARHARVVVVDARGNGRSGRPDDAAAYADTELAADTVAVMDEVGVGTAVLVGLCSSVWTALLVAADHPDRVAGLVAIAPWLPFVTPPHPARAGWDFDAVLETDEGWAKDNRFYRLRDYRGFLEFFFGELLPEAHSSKQWEDGIGWAVQTTPQILNAVHDAPVCVADAAGVHALLEKVRGPALVINGEEDRCQPAARATALAEALGAQRLVLAGAGHLPNAREPVTVNLAVRDFVDRVLPPPPAAVRRARPLRSGPRVLYLGSPIGLGHARRDLAIAEQLRAQRPDVRVDWLAQPPITQWLLRRGESVHPGSAGLASEAAHVDASCGEHDLHAFQTIRDMDEIMVANFMVFQDIVERERYDLWVGDEAWELDHFLYENPELKRSAYAWLTDFVGWLPMPEGGPREAELTADYNAETLEQIARLPRIRDKALFVGNPEDIVEADFGPALPPIRDWTRDHFEFTGYVTGFDPAEIADRAALRAEFGWGDEPVCLVAVGGSGAGGHLLRRAIEAHPLAAQQCPGLRTVVVTGPRIDPASLPTPPGVEVHGWLPDLHRRLAAADTAIVQGGLTTTMELTAAGRPFVFVPLRRHFEQNRHVRHRLARYGAGRCVEWDDASAERLAAEMVELIGTTPTYRPVETDGAARAAAHLAALV